MLKHSDKWIDSVSIQKKDNLQSKGRGKNGVSSANDDDVEDDEVEDKEYRDAMHEFGYDRRGANATTGY